jgi:1-deoxy-D-xylulose-5-phosphate synthase
MDDVGRHRQPVVFVLDRAGITGDDGASHHGVYDMALLSRVPGMTVLAPSSAQELQQMLRDAIGLLDAGPVAIRYPKGQARRCRTIRSSGSRGAEDAGGRRSRLHPRRRKLPRTPSAAQLLNDDGSTRRSGTFAAVRPSTRR